MKTDAVKSQLNKSFEERPGETFSMFKPLEYWENRL
jgi:hypothetical protein